MTDRRSVKSAMAEESLAGFFQRVKNGGARKPLRNVGDFADEFGVARKSLTTMLNRSLDAPKPLFKTGGGKGSSPSNTWYDPEAVRAWWKSRTEKKT